MNYKTWPNNNPNPNQPTPMEAPTQEFDPIEVDFDQVPDSKVLYSPGEYELRLAWVGDLKQGDGIYEKGASKGQPFKWANFSVIVDPTAGDQLEEDKAYETLFASLSPLALRDDDTIHMKRFIRCFVPHFLDGGPVQFNQDFFDALQEAIGEGVTVWCSVGLGKHYKTKEDENVIRRWGPAV